MEEMTIIIKITGQNETLLRQITDLLSDYEDAQIEVKQQTENPEISFHGLEMNLARRRARIRGREVELTPIEFDILYFLASHMGIAFTRKQIYEAVWNEDFVGDTESVTTHIAHLRKKIEPDLKFPTYIQTVRKVGYRFIK